MSVGGGLSVGTGKGALGLGTPQVAQSFALPAMSKTALAYIAHLYDRNLTFKRLLGTASIISKPSLKQTQNGGFQPIVLKVAQQLSVPSAIFADSFETPGPTGTLFHSIGTEAGSTGTLNDWVTDGGAPSIAAHVVTLPLSAQIHAGSPFWTDTTWNLRFQFATGAIPLFYSRYSPTDWARAHVDGANLHIDQFSNGAQTNDVVPAVACALVNATSYWVRSVWSGNTLTCTVFADSAGALGAQIATLSATIGTSVAAGLISIQAGGATAGFTFGGAFANACTVTGATVLGWNPAIVTGEPAFAVCKSPFGGLTCLAITNNFGTDNGYWAGPVFSVAAATYTAAAQVRATGGTQILGAGTVGPTVSFSDNGWHFASASGMDAPGNVAFTVEQLGVGTAAFDNVALYPGTVAFPGVEIGDVIRLTEQGDPTSSFLYSGNVETTPEENAPGGATTHTLELTPWIAELADADFDHVYAATDSSGGTRTFTVGPVDVAQFVRDAAALTKHCSTSPVSCPNTGIMATYDFQGSNGLDAVHVAKQIAGASYFYFVDAQGLVWFQPVYTDTLHPATLTLRRGADFNYKLAARTVKGMKNRFRIYGGSNPGDPGRIKSAYGVSTDPLGNQALYGVRAYNPSLSYPTVTDQPTLDAIAASLGAQFDRVLQTVVLRCPALGLRLSPARAGGLTVRFLEPAVEAMAESAQASGIYSPTLILQDVEALGPKQILTIGSIPYTDTDPAYEATRVAQRMSAIGSTAQATPALTPQVAPPATSIYGAVNAATGIYAMGGGIVTIATASFTTLKTGVCAVVGAVDARMEAWDDYIAVPRRAVRAVLSGGIFTGAWQELPFGLTRATYDLSSATGIALPAGTYTVSIQIDTQEFNQMHIYSGWAQVVVTA